MNLLSFHAETHRYFVDGIELPAVTAILQPAYSDVFRKIDPDVLAEKQLLGTYVHLACELEDRGTLIESTVDAVVYPYLDAWRRFKIECRPTILLNEQRLFHPKWRYAGTLDRLLEFAGAKWLVDLKTAVAFYPPVAMQLAAYVELVKSNYPEHQALKRGALKLKSDGSYSFNPYPAASNDWPAFIGLLNYHHWRVSHGIED